MLGAMQGADGSPTMPPGAFHQMPGSYMGGMYPIPPYPSHGEQAGESSFGKGGFGGGGESMKGGMGKGFKGGFKGGFGGGRSGFGGGRGGGGGKGFKGGGYGGGGYGGGYGSFGYGGGSYGGVPNYSGAWTPDSAEAHEADATRQIEIAQRRAKFRERSAITQAQRSAQLRFERDLLDRVQGNWVDESDRSVSYVVEGSMCTVSGGENARVFRNRISFYNGELCWDARRWWHNLNIKSLPPGGEPAERVEWVLGEGSPAVKDIVWIRGDPPVLMPVKVVGAEHLLEGGYVDDPIGEEDDVFAVPPDAA